MNLPCCNPCITCEPTAATDGRNIIVPDPNDPANPFLNLSSATPDVDYFIGRHYPPQDPPPIGSLWYASGCITTCISSVSQQDADICAANQNVLCLSGNWPVIIPNPNGPNPPGFPPAPPRIPDSRPVFGNRPQSCTYTCPDGSPFTFTTGAGKFLSLSQDAADALASNYACHQALAIAICVSDLVPSSDCIGNFYDGEIIVSLPSRTFTATIISGALPPGLTMEVSPSLISILGNPTTVGNYTFTIRVLDASGNFMDKTYTISINQILTASPLPDATVGVFYSLFLQVNASMGTPTWSFVSGTPPPGIALNANTGRLFFTPDESGTFSFVVAATAGNKQCKKEFTITVAQAACDSLDGLTWNTYSSVGDVDGSGFEGEFSIHAHAPPGAPAEPDIGIHASFVWPGGNKVFTIAVDSSIIGSGHWGIDVQKDFVDILFYQNTDTGLIAFSLVNADAGATIDIYVFGGTANNANDNTMDLSGTISCADGIGNEEQSSHFTCTPADNGPGGDATVAANTFVRPTLAEANAVALSQAQAEAQSNACCAPWQKVDYDQPATMTPAFLTCTLVPVTGPNVISTAKVIFPSTCVPPGSTKITFSITASGGSTQCLIMNYNDSDPRSAVPVATQNGDGTVAHQFDIATVGFAGAAFSLQCGVGTAKVICTVTFS